MAEISNSSSPPFPPPVRRVIFAFSKSSAVNPFLRRTCLAKGCFVRLDRSHQLVAIFFVGVNPRLSFSGFFLQSFRRQLLTVRRRRAGFFLH